MIQSEHLHMSQPPLKSYPQLMRKVLKPVDVYDKTVKSKFCKYSDYIPQRLEELSSRERKADTIRVVYC